jgi:hypothetical protein
MMDTVPVHTTGDRPQTGVVVMRHTTFMNNESNAGEVSSFDKEVAFPSKAFRRGISDLGPETHGDSAKRAVERVMIRL